MSNLTQRRQPVVEVDLTKTTSEDDLPSFTPPSFTVKDLLGAIPKHCFERSALKSSVYTVVELAVIAALFYAASFIDGNFGRNGAVLDGGLGVAAKWTLWSAYWFWQGCVMTGIWVIAHECGHQAYSTSKTINNAVGLVLHSSLLVPYHSWRISHARHHAATGHMTRDEVFVPKTKSQAAVQDDGTGKKSALRHGPSRGQIVDELLEDAPAYRLFWLVMQQLLGWPLYIIMNASGQKHYPKNTSHFNPEAIIFQAHHRNQVLLSDAALLVMGTVLQQVGQKIGWGALVKYYFIPYLCVNHWLVMITFLQHTDPALPHYRGGEWTFPRGALCTIDRNLMGSFIGPYIFHGICETHVSHHICSKIPHYNAWEATEALKSLLGEHYVESKENMFVSLYKNFRNCRYVDDEGEVLFFRDARGQISRNVNLVADSGVETSME